MAIKQHNHKGGDSPDSISILICSKNRRNAMETLVKSIFSMKTKLVFEIIIVEETSNPIPIDGTIYISHPKADRGIPYARNLALTHAKGDIIVFLDDDCLIHDHWLDMLLEPFQDSSVVGVQGGVSIPPDTNSIGWIESLLGFPGGGIARIIKSNGKCQDTREISTLNCAYRKWAVDKAGGFDERLKLGGEDYVLAKKVCDYGKCVFVPKALVSHEARGSFAKIWSWFVRRGHAEIGVIKAGTQTDTVLGTLLRRSISLKLLAIITLGFLVYILFSGWAISFAFIIIIIFVYYMVQYSRYYKIWKACAAPSRTLLLLPIVKIWMDLGMDWGKIRGVILD